jgi:soluble lytic murein transglycosylase
MNKPRLIFSRYNPLKRERRRKLVAVASSAGVCALLIGTTLLVTKHSSQLKQWSVWLPFQEQNPLMQGKKVSTSVLQLVSLPKKQRAEQLEVLASPERSVFSPQQNAITSPSLELEPLNRSRARYLLAADLIEKKQGEKALRLLEGLEWDYPVLAAQIALKRAHAYELTGNNAKALEAWKDLLKGYPNEPQAAEALYKISLSDPQYWKTAGAEFRPHPISDPVRHWHSFSADDPQYWNRAITQFPSHPRILQIARDRLKENPRQPQLMLLLARYAFDTPDISLVLDKLVSRYGEAEGDNDKPLIQPEDWEAIALGYWNDRKYGQASLAYTKAPHTPRNAYLVALGLQYAEHPKDAKQAYKKMVREFPHAEETATALFQLAQLEPTTEVLPLLDKIVQQFPDHVGEALYTKAAALDSLGNEKAAAQTRQLLLDKYGNSEAAADYRWQVAQSKAKAGDLEAAFKWAKPIATNNPDSQLARQAGFWVGKWANKLGYQQEAKAAFEQVVANHSQSYYAWRSAVQLGWDVGDFTTVRKLNPQVVLPATRPPLPMGSAALKELYQLGQERDAWILWQAEFQNRLQPTVTEQFTDGLLRLGVGDYLGGIAKISSLEDRKKPEEQAQYQALKQQLTYWQALYPTPFLELIEEQSQQFDVNPLLVTAVIRQESRFDPEIRSKAGAVGLMQMMPNIGALVAKRIKLKDYALDNPNDNIKLGTWLLDETHQAHKDNSLFAIASYNAGQSNISRWIAEKQPKDPDEFVETIPFDETRDYVKQVFGNYWNYLRLYDPQVQARLDKYSASQSTAMQQ